MNALMLNVEGLTKSFDGPGGIVRVLVDVSLCLRNQEHIAVMGPSGSGKSTLLSILGTLERPSAGSVRVDGINPFEGSPADLAVFRNKTIGFIFQDHHLLEGCTAIDNVIVPAMANGTVSADVLVRAESLLDRVGLAARRMHLPSELSGGERQRVAVARSLILSPRLILADEPTGNLDTHSSEMITELLVELASEIMGMLVVVTHSQTVADRMGSIARLNDGRLLRL